MKQFLCLALWGAASFANAQQHPLFKDADLKAGEKLIAENQPKQPFTGVRKPEHDQW